VQDFSNLVFTQFDIRIEEGVNTTTQRQLAFAQKIQLLQMGVPIAPEDLLEEATMQNKDKVIERIQQAQQQAQQMQEQEMQMQMFKIQAEAKALDAASMANQGLGLERLSRIEENRALAIEKINESEAKKAQGTLDAAKTLKELQEIDLNQIQKLIIIANTLKQTMIDDEAKSLIEPLKETPSFSLSESLQ
jgi:hypothetical protein